MSEINLEAALAKKICEIRNAKNLSMAQLGKLCGITAQRVYELELGKKVPRLTTLIKIADGLGVSIFDIIDEPLGRKKVNYLKPPCANSRVCPFYQPLKT
jgi:transcriptional regulator with XRE-family HTH domain